MDRSYRWGLLLLLQAMSFQLQASEDYWVVLGSLAEHDGVARLTEAAAPLGQPVSSQVVETDRGSMHRVVAGPYTDKNDAQQVAASARAQGFPDAWLLQAESAQVSDSSATLEPATVSTNAPVATVAASDQAETGLAVQDPASAPAYASETGLEDQNTVPPLTPDAAQQESTRELLDQNQDEIPDSAPPGYNLNKLRREG